MQDVEYLDPLWEIYGHDPILFMRMADWADSVNANYFFTKHFLELRRQNDYCKFNAMLKSWKVSHHQKSASTAAFLEILQEDWNAMRECWSLYDDLRDGDVDGIMPFQQGLRLVLDQLVSYTVEKEARTAVEIMGGSRYNQ